MGKDGASERWRDYTRETAVKSYISSLLTSSGLQVELFHTRKFHFIKISKYFQTVFTKEVGSEKIFRKHYDQNGERYCEGNCSLQERKDIYFTREKENWS